MAEEQKTPVETVRCVIVRDFWDADEVRHPAGKEIDVPVAAAFDGIETGILKRVK